MTINPDTLGAPHIGLTGPPLPGAYRPPPAYWRTHPLLQHGPLTAQQHQDILNSANVFEEGVTSMGQVFNEVFTAGDTLKGQAMVCTAGQMFGVAVARWTDDFNNIKMLLQQMHDQLMATTQQTTATNVRNLHLASGLGNGLPTP
jgi:hypothetical protein